MRKQKFSFLGENFGWPVSFRKCFRHSCLYPADTIFIKNISGLYYILQTLLLLIKTSHPVPHCHCHVLILFIGKFRRDVVLVLDVDWLSLAFSSCSQIPLLWEQEILCKPLKFCLLSFRFYILTWKCGFKIIYSHLSPLPDPRMKLSPFQEKHNCHNFAQETKNFKSLEQLILYSI